MLFNDLHAEMTACMCQCVWQIYRCHHVVCGYADSVDMEIVQPCILGYACGVFRFPVCCMCVPTVWSEFGHNQGLVCMN